MNKGKDKEAPLPHLHDAHSIIPKLTLLGAPSPDPSSGPLNNSLNQPNIFDSPHQSIMPADYQSAAAGLSVDDSASSSEDNNNTTRSSSASPSAPPPPRSSSTNKKTQQYKPFTDDDVVDEPPPPAPHGDGAEHNTRPPLGLPWVHNSSSNNNSNNSNGSLLASSAARRLSMPYSQYSRRRSSTTTGAGGGGRGGLDLRAQLGALTSTSVKTARNVYRQSTTLYASLTPTQQFLVLAGGVLLLALTVTLLVFSHKIFLLLGPVAVSWRALPGGWLIIWGLTFLVAFPPLIGYSTACTVSGFVYGFPLGWPVVATATVAGSLAAFVASRTVFSAYVDRLVGHDKRFVALGQVLRHDGLGVLALARFCPLPYSLSNGFLATVPSIQPGSFALATAIASPKLLVHVFIGSRLALLAEQGDTMGFGDRVINFLSMLVGGLIGVGVGWVIYRRTMARAAELAREDAARGRPFDAGAGAGSGGVGSNATGGPPREYVDDDVLGHGGEDARLMDPNDAAALMVDDDDISLWDATGDGDRFEDDEAGRGGYRDEEEAVGGVGSKKGPR